MRSSRNTVPGDTPHGPHNDGRLAQAERDRGRHRRGRAGHSAPNPAGYRAACRRRNVAEHLERLVETHHRYPGRTSIPGLTVRTLGIFITAISDTTFAIATALASYAGLATIIRQS